MSFIVDDRPSLDSEVRMLQTKVEMLETQLAERRSPRVSILSEPLTYDARLVRDRHSQGGFRAVSRENRSYIKDLVLAEKRGDWDALERLHQHEREMSVLAKERNSLFHPDVEYGFEQRAVNWASGTGGYFAPPLWIIEHFAVQPTPERVLSELAPKFDLPLGAQSVNLPAWSQGADVAVDAVSAGEASQDPVDVAVSSAVTTIAGNFDAPMQLLEQSPQGAHLDWVAFTVMEARYGYRLEQQLFVGTGAATPQGSGNNQLLGIFNNTLIPTGNQLTFTNGGVSAEAAPGTAASSAQGATSMYSYLGFLISMIGQRRLLPPQCWLMTTSRHGWLGSSEDLQNRPLMISDNPIVPGRWDLMGFPVYMDNAIPRTSGTGGNEERILLCRPDDWLILESEPHVQIMPDVISGTLQVRLQYRRYAASLLRRPESVAFLLGAGMATGGGW